MSNDIYVGYNNEYIIINIILLINNVILEI